MIDLNGPEPGGETTWCDPLAELGWLHVGHRYYDPTSGRFVQRDPIGIAGGLNTYAYVLNDPLSGVDPSGLILGWLWGDEETGDWLLDLTGGRHSWLDNQKTVRGITGVTDVVGVGCAAVLVAYAAAPLAPTLWGGGTAATGSEVVAVTAELATGVAYRGGVKLTVYVAWNGKTYILDALIRAGQFFARHPPHYKCKPPWPPLPPFLN